MRGKDECWPWIGTIHKIGGYGRLKFRRIVKKAHRFSWELHFDQMLPETLLVCHHCDNPPCCNPDHFFIGDHGANADDRDKKGRQIPFKGEEHGCHKLTEAQILELKDMYANGIRGKQLDSHFSIAQGYGWRIATGKSWAHVS